MSVELTRTGLNAKMYLDNPCTCCGEKLWPPFMVWRCETDILICSDCAEHIRDGFMADLVHLSAVKQFQKLQAGNGHDLGSDRRKDPGGCGQGLGSGSLQGERHQTEVTPAPAALGAAAPSNIKRLDRGT